MKTAILILAYRAAPVLGVTIPLLRAAGWDIFVHLDTKADSEAYKSALGEGAAECRFIDDPVAIFWGGYTMIRAELKLMGAARRSGPYEKYILLSDDTFPALPPEALAHRFDNDQDQVTLERQGQKPPFLYRYKDFFCYDHEITGARGAARSGRNIVSGAVDQALEYKIAEIAVLRRNGKKDLELYYGSQFWALTSKSVELILAVVSKDLHLTNSFEYSALPDESMIQSILGNYLYGHRLDTGPVYVDFSTGGPRLIAREEDLPRDLQQPHAFIRKLSSANPTFLLELSSRLKAGLKIDGIPADKRRSLQQVTDEFGRTRVTIRLTAPAEAAGPSWHGIESFWGRRYRWTSSDRVKWSMETGIVTPGAVRFILTTVIASAKEWMANCKLRLNDVTQTLDLVNGELIAEFEHNGLQAVEVELITPELTIPSETVNSHDTRRLGLSVAL